MQMMFGAGGGDALLVAQVTGTTSSLTPNSLSAVVGDLAIGISQGGLSSGSGVAWSFINIGGNGLTFYRFLTSGDMAAPIISAGGNMVLYFIRGVTSINIAVTDSGTAGTPHFRTASGFTRSANHAGLLAFTINSTSAIDTPASTPAPVTNPTLFTTNSLAPYSLGGINILALAYRLQPAAPPYVNNTSFTYGD